MVYYNLLKINTLTNDGDNILINVTNHNVFYMLKKKTINDLLYLLNQISLDTFLECIDDQNYNYIRKILGVDFADSTSVKIKHILKILDGFLNFFDNINSEISGYC